MSRYNLRNHGDDEPAQFHSGDLTSPERSSPRLTRPAPSRSPPGDPKHLYPVEELAKMKGRQPLRSYDRSFDNSNNMEDDDQDYDEPDSTPLNDNSNANRSRRHDDSSRHDKSDGEDYVDSSFVNSRLSTPGSARSNVRSRTKSPQTPRSEGYDSSFLSETSFSNVSPVVPRSTRSRREQNKNASTTKSPKSKGKPKEDHTCFYDFSINEILIVVILMIVLFFVSKMVYGAYFGPEQSEEGVTRSSREEDYVKLKDSLQNFQQDFPSQTNRFWKTLRASLKRIVAEDESDSPSTLLFAVPKPASKVAGCISSRISREINRVFSITTVNYFDASKISHLEDNEEKIKLDDYLLQTLRQNGSAVVIDHFERLAPKAAILLHSYSDGDNAPFKRAVLALVYHMDTNAVRDRFEVERSIRDLWIQELDDDKIGALLSRIANNILTLEPETDDIINLSCKRT